VLILALAAAPQAQRQAADTEPTQLPVRRVVLYKSGVGFFEHQGSVNGSVDVAIQFTSGQLNDVLKSLTALDLDNGQISSIGYNSVAPLEQRLAALRLPLDSKPDLLQFYNALRGARVDVQTGAGVISGRLLGLERKPARDAASEPTDVLTVIANDGSVRSIVLRPNVSVRIAERDLRDDISRYLAVVASGRDQDIRRMTLAANGSGTRRLVVSYVSEVPIWKSTYRLVLPEGDAAPVLQGWAVVDNTVGADWTNVELSLVAGAPQSFVQRVSQPHYARRPEVPLPQTVLLNPQTHQATLLEGTGTLRGVVRDTQGGPLPGATVTLIDPFGRTATQATTNSSGTYQLDAAGGTYRLTVTLPGFGTQTRNVTLTSGSSVTANATMSIGGLGESIVVTGESPAVDVQNARQSVQSQGRVMADGLVVGRGGGAGGGVFAAPPSRFAAEDVQAARLAQPAAASAQDLGDLFEYRLTQPVTIRTNQSAMVPILNAKVNAERVSIWNRSTGSGRPLRAVWLTNTSGLTLDGGSLSVIEGNAFAGEGLVEPLKPSEKRLVSYGSDLAVMVDARLDESSGRYTRVVARDGVVIAYEETRQGWDYRIRNEDATPRTLIIEHPVRAGWTLNATPAPAETTASAHRFRVPVAARAEATLSLTERLAGEARFSIDQMDDRLIASFGQRGVSVEELRRFLQPVIEARTRLADAERRSQELAAQVTSVGSDQERMRENIKALGTSRQERALKERYTRELGAQEDRLQALQKGVDAANTERDQRRSELSALMQKLTFEVIVK
jgi:hypothetical protein